MGYSAYFAKSTPPRVFSISFNTLQQSFRHIQDVYEDFFEEENNIFKNIDKLQLYEEF